MGSIDEAYKMIIMVFFFFGWKNGHNGRYIGVEVLYFDCVKMVWVGIPFGYAVLEVVLIIVLSKLDKICCLIEAIKLEHFLKSKE